VKKKIIQLSLSAIPIAFHLSAQQPGQLDSTFNSDGIVTTDYSGLSQEARSVCIQPDSKIVVAGVTFNGANQDFIICRYNSDGSLDSAFGTNGKVRTDQYQWELGCSVAIDSSGNIVAAGLGGYIPTGAAVAKYKSDGTLDSSFSSNGIETILIGIDCYSMVVQPDEKILLAGGFHLGNTKNFGLIRLNPDGDFDASFGGGGTVYADYYGNDDVARAVILQEDGKIIVAGSTAGSGLIVRFNSNGTIDTTFDGGMITSTPSVYSLAIQTDGKIIAAGRVGSNLDFAAQRFLPDGSIDVSFGINGLASFDISDTTDQCTSIALQQDNKIILAGYVWDGTHQNIGVIRLNTDGSLDASFGADGKIIFDISGVNDYCQAAAVQSDGKIILAGGTFSQPPYEDILVMRLISGLNVGELFLSKSEDACSLFPNPTTQSTSLDFTLNSPARVGIDVFDVVGNKVKQVLYENLQTGKHHIIIDVHELKDGLYLLRLSEGDITKSHKLVVMN